MLTSVPTPTSRSRAGQKNRPRGGSRFYQVENGRFILALYVIEEVSDLVTCACCPPPVVPKSVLTQWPLIGLKQRWLVVWFGTCVALFYSAERSPSHTHIHSVLWSNMISNIHTASNSLGATWASVSFLRVFQHADLRNLGLIHWLSSW